jgi:hypothetical protein
MMSFRAAIAAFVLMIGAGIFVPALASAQVITDERLWTNLSLQERQGTESPWRWSAEFSLRTHDGIDDVDVFVMRGLFGYDLSERTSLSLGFAVIPSFPVTGGTLVEKRLFEQYVWSGHSGGGALALRTRFEQRWAEGNTGLVWRLRHQVRYTRPFSPASRFSFFAYDEIFFHANKTARYVRGLEQNRASGGISRTLSGHVRLEVSYLNQFSRVVTGPDRVNHILSVGTVVAF